MPPVRFEKWQSSHQHVTGLPAFVAFSTAFCNNAADSVRAGMQFDFSVAEAFGLQGAGVALLTDQALRGMPPARLKRVEAVLDGMGRGSQAAQGLPAPVTSLAYIRDAHHFLLLAIDGDRCLGILKGGVKHLFMLDSEHETHEMDATCCLDFYTHESARRRGIGTRLFRAMEHHTRIAAPGWAFDRPSPRLLAFLAGVYGMQGFRAQSNNFLMLDAAIRLWGAEFRQYRRSGRRYVPDAYLLPAAEEGEYLGAAGLAGIETGPPSSPPEGQPAPAPADADALLALRPVVLPPGRRRGGPF